jgi:hypothetical protein
LNADHVQYLRELAHIDHDMIGGTAAAALFRILPEKRRDIINSIVDLDHYNYNYIQAFAEDSKAYWTTDDVRHALHRICEFPSGGENIKVISRVLANLPAHESEQLCSTFMDRGARARKVVVETLRNLKTDFATVSLRNLVAEGDVEAIFNLYLHVHYSRPDFPASLIPPNRQLARVLLRALSDRERCQWFYDLAKILVGRDPSWGALFSSEAEGAEQKIIVVLLLTAEESMGDALNDLMRNSSNIGPCVSSVIGHLSYWLSARSGARHARTEECPSRPKHTGDPARSGKHNRAAAKKAAYLVA